MVLEMVMIHIGEDVGATSEAPQLEETNVGVLSRLEEEKAIEGTFGDSSMPLG